MANTSNIDVLPAAGAGREVTALQWRRTLAAAICSLGGTAFGYDLGALAGATQGLTRSYTLSPALFGLTVSASLWGAVFASPLAGRLADRMGRRGLLVLCAAAYALAGGALAIFYVFFRQGVRTTLWNLFELIRFRLTSGLQPHPSLNVREAGTVRVPFGVAIAVGTLLCAGNAIWWR